MLALSDELLLFDIGAPEGGAGAVGATVCCTMALVTWGAGGRGVAEIAT